MFLLILRLLDLINIALIVYILLSWFPLNPNGIPMQIRTFIGSLIEPILEPIRRRVPPLGPFDSAFLIFFLGLWLLRIVITALAYGR